MNTLPSSGPSATSQGSTPLTSESTRTASVSRGPESSSGTPVETELQTPALSVEELSQVVEAMNETMTQMSRALNFEVDSDSDELVIRVTDKDTGELIRQIPSEDTLKLMQHIEEMHNILFEASA